MVMIVIIIANMKIAHVTFCTPIVDCHAFVHLDYSSNIEWYCIVLHGIQNALITCKMSDISIIHFKFDKRLPNLLHCFEHC